MILKALYDYYNRMGNLASLGTEDKQIGFLIVLTKEGKFVRIEDCRNDDKKSAKAFRVRRPVKRTSGVATNHLYDSAGYVLGYAPDKPDKEQLYFNAFFGDVVSTAELHSDNVDIQAVKTFLSEGREKVQAEVMADPLWPEIEKSMNKKYSILSFRIDGDLRMVAEKEELLDIKGNEKDVENKGDGKDDKNKCNSICLITGLKCEPVKLTTATMIPGSQAVATLVAFQKGYGFDSYGHEQCGNSPISPEAEFAFTTALKTLISLKSNKRTIGSRTFLFWASSDSEASKQAEYALLRVMDGNSDDPNFGVVEVEKAFKNIFSGKTPANNDKDRFYILGLAPNSARIAIVFWQETTVQEFAGCILRHLNDMDMGTRNDNKFYKGVYSIISAVTLNRKVQDATPNLLEAVAESIFRGTLYPVSLYQACLRRIRAEQEITITRAAIIKAYLIRNHKENIATMLDTKNTDPAYLSGRLFAILDYMQGRALGDINRGIRQRFIATASTTPAQVFPQILQLSMHHQEKLEPGTQIYFDNLKQEVIDKLGADGFPKQLDMQAQGRFFIGYYHQRQVFYTAKGKETDTKQSNE